ncbi:MAG: molybdopterin-dependent oxidoreductase, partial [Deltaproteobacteria bacterium]|nr:molybdopterin-dependent oxidoreductase [Deltaproteobacteria bacterium]
MDLGQDRQGHPHPGQLHLGLRVGRLRQGRDRLARGAERHLRGAAIYEAPRDDVPDQNPRGCQKGACYSDLQVSGSRVLHPLKRVGPRGGGQWKRISWDDAYSEIADRIIDAAVESGSETIIHDHGTTNAGFGPETAG